MRKSLRSNAATLNSKRSEARKSLPRFDSATYEAIRLEEDKQYRKAKEHRELEGRKLQERIERNRKELEIAANTQHRGVGQGGAPRAMTQKEATEKIRAARGQ